MSIKSNGIPTSHKADRQVPWMPKRCGAQIRKSDPPKRCQRAAEPGMNVCWRHGGRTKGAKDGAVRRLATHKLIKLGVPITVEPRQALLDQVYAAYGMVQAVSLMAQGVNPEALTDSDEDVRREAATIVHLLSDWTDRAARISKMALDVGIEERMVRLAERQGDAIVAIIRAIVIGLELPQDRAQIAYRIAANELRGLTTDSPINVTPEASVK